MPITLNKVVNLGSAFGGLATVGFRVVNTTGAIVVARTTVGVIEIATGLGVYSAPVTFPSSDFKGAVVWDDDVIATVASGDEVNLKDAGKSVV